MIHATAFCILSAVYYDFRSFYEIVVVAGGGDGSAGAAAKKSAIARGKKKEERIAWGCGYHGDDENELVLSGRERIRSNTLYK